MFLIFFLLILTQRTLPHDACSESLYVIGILERKQIL